MAVQGKMFQFESKGMQRCVVTASVLYNKPENLSKLREMIVWY